MCRFAPYFLFLFPTVFGVTTSDVVNLINPFWSTPDGGNIADQFAASVVGVDSTATTYSIGCASNINATKKLCDEEFFKLVYTQGPTSMHFSKNYSSPGCKYSDCDTITVSLTGDYKYASTLALVVTATEIYIEGDDPGIYNSYANTVLSTTTSTQSFITTDTLSTYAATWHAIPITGGLEKLTGQPPSITPAATLRSSSTGAAETAVSSSKPSGGSQLAPNGHWLVGVILVTMGYSAL